MLQCRITGRAGAPSATQSPLQASCAGDTGAAKEGHRASERTACVPAGGQGWPGATQGPHPRPGGTAAAAAGCQPDGECPGGHTESGRLLPRTGRAPIALKLWDCRSRLAHSAGMPAQRARRLRLRETPGAESPSSLLPGQTAAHSELLWMPDPCREEGVMSEATCTLQGKPCIWTD